MPDGDTVSCPCTSYLRMNTPSFLYQQKFGNFEYVLEIRVRWQNSFVKQLTLFQPGHLDNT